MNIVKTNFDLRPGMIVKQVFFSLLNCIFFKYKIAQKLVAYG